MAGLPATQTESIPLRGEFGLTLLICLVVLRPAAAQGTEDGTPGLVRAAPELAVTRLAGAWVVQAGGSVSLQMDPRVQIGGLGRIGLDHPTVETDGSCVRARFGYGGLTVSWRPASARWPGLSISLLAGAGNVDVEEPNGGAMVDSDNGAIVEPALRISRPLADRLALAGVLSWRLAFGFDALGGIDSGRLRGPGLALGVVVGPF